MIMGTFAASTLLALLAIQPSATAHTGIQTNPISAVRMNAMDRELASDAFQGRAPGTAGEEKTIAWLIAHLKLIGLEPAGPAGKWTQQVPLVRTKLGNGRVTASVNGHAIPLAVGRDIYLNTVRPLDNVSLNEVPMVFVGYGVSAPERAWDDFKGTDLHGKIAVMLVNDPDFQAESTDDSMGKFGGRRMTYYGRWTYKYEEAARRGAIGALIVHDTPGAGYGWETVTAPQGENYDVADATGRLTLQGWLEGSAATNLFRSAGLDLDRLRVAARRSDFKPIQLNARFSANMPVTHERLMSRNVLARIRGSARPDEAIMYGAHWDAYGVGAPDVQGKRIRPGANDDALGVVGLLEIARAFKAGPPPRRSVLFGFWSAEERGLLGSETYALNPVVAPAKTVANITLDILQTGGPSRDVMLVGQGQNSLEGDLATAAKAQGRTITPEALPERGLFYRADHFSLAKRGVPTLLFMAISGAPDLVRGGRSAGAAWLADYMKCYHQTCDSWRPDWNLEGAAQDVALAYRVGKTLSMTAVQPTWNAGSEFRSIRENSTRR
jgi:Zn-dependent M28 family amino/carboxypeptidase